MADPITSTLADLQALGLFVGVGDVYVAQLTTQDTETEAPVYAAPIVAAEAVSVGLTPTYAEGTQSASDRTIRKIKLLKGMDVAIEYPRIKAEVSAMLLGRGIDANGGEVGGDGMAPEVAVGVCATRDDGTRLMRWIYKVRFSEGQRTDKTAEEGTIAYTIPTLEGSGVPLTYLYAGADNKTVRAVQYVADTANPACKWTPETFFAQVVGPWSTAQASETQGGEGA